MATEECYMHQNIKDAMVRATELDTTHIFRSLRNTSRVFKNKVSSNRPGQCSLCSDDRVVLGRYAGCRDGEQTWWRRVQGDSARRSLALAPGPKFFAMLMCITDFTACVRCPRQAGVRRR